VVGHARGAGGGLSQPLERWLSKLQNPASHRPANRGAEDDIVIGIATNRILEGDRLDHFEASAKQPLVGEYALRLTKK
jgi:hypothetical protein